MKVISQDQLYPNRHILLENVKMLSLKLLKKIEQQSCFTGCSLTTSLALLVSSCQEYVMGFNSLFYCMF